jgi:glycosyltransferase involved in cell wall biosynthesis
MNLSIVIPLLNEQESLPELHQWIVNVMTTHKYTYEILFIDDGSTDDSWNIIENLSAENPNVKGIRFLKNYGKSQALHAGFARAKGDVIITMDADLQDSPEEIPELYEMITKSRILIWFPVGKRNDMILLFAKISFKIIQLGCQKNIWCSTE